MSCENNANKAAQAATKNGISKNAGKSSFVAGSTTKITVFCPEKKARVPKVSKDGGPKRSKKKKFRLSKKKELARNSKTAQTSFFEAAASPKVDNNKGLPTQRHILLGKEFTEDELLQLTTQLRFGTAAAERYLRGISSGLKRGIGHSDPRPADWVQLDLKQYQFLVNQLVEARRGRGYLDMSSLSKKQLIDLWEFARFEIDRTNRNIDHLNVPGGPIGGETAEYLVGKHKLEVRFFNLVATQIERMVPAEELDAEIGQLF